MPDIDYNKFNFDSPAILGNQPVDMSTMNTPTASAPLPAANTPFYKDTGFYKGLLGAVAPVGTAMITSRLQRQQPAPAPNISGRPLVPSLGLKSSSGSDFKSLLMQLLGGR